MPKTRGYVLFQTQSEPLARVLIALIERFFAKAAWKPQLTYERNQVVVWNGNATQTKFLDGYVAGTFDGMDECSEP